VASMGIMCALVPASALASHVRPAAGAAFRVPIVVAFQQCNTPNRTHGPSLTAPSCNPARQASSWLTVGTTDANGYPSSSSAFAKINVCPSGNTTTGICSTPTMSGEDVRIESKGTDVRCRVGGPTQTNCEGGALSDYTGQLQGNATIRITDHHNCLGAGGTGCTGDTATVSDLPFPVNGQCAANPANNGTFTGPLAIGGTCTTLTSANATVPGAVVPAKRANVEITQILIFDGGQGGVAGAPDATLFGVQGIFIP
jgi:hypothetical protein